MALYVDLSAADKDVFDAWMTQVRAGQGQLARMMTALEVIRADYLAQVNDVVVTLDAGAVIPNNSGLSGAGEVTKEEAIAAALDLVSLLDTFNTDVKRQGYVKFAGPQNILG